MSWAAGVSGEPWAPRTGQTPPRSCAAPLQGLPTSGLVRAGDKLRAPSGGQARQAPSQVGWEPRWPPASGGTCGKVTTRLGLPGCRKTTVQAMVVPSPPRSPHACHVPPSTSLGGSCGPPAGDRQGGHHVRGSRRRGQGGREAAAAGGRPRAHSGCHLEPRAGRGALCVSARLGIFREVCPFPCIGKADPLCGMLLSGGFPPFSPDPV